jgi:hypothetical protein
MVETWARSAYEPAAFQDAAMDFRRLLASDQKLCHFSGGSDNAEAETQKA